MLPDAQARFVAEACRALYLVEQLEGQGPRFRALLASYREVADALGCLMEWEEALLRQTLHAHPPANRRANVTTTGAG